MSKIQYLLILPMILIICGITALADGNPPDEMDFLFSLSEDNAVLVSYGGDSSVVNVPEEIDGKPVIVIGAGAFQDCEWIEAVVLPDSIWYIDDEAFSGCTSLREIHMPAMITEIGKSVFRNCRALTEINLPQNLSLLGSGAFENCSSLKEIHLPYGVWHIEENTFLGCTSLRNVFSDYPELSNEDENISGIVCTGSEISPDEWIVEEGKSLADIPLSSVTPAPRGELHYTNREPTGNWIHWRGYRRHYWRRWGAPPWRPYYYRYYRPHRRHYYDSYYGRYYYWPRGWRWHWGPPLWGNMTLEKSPEPTVEHQEDGTIVAVETEVGYFGLMSVRIIVKDDVILSAEAYEQFTELEDGVQELYEAVAGSFVGESASVTGSAYVIDMKKDKCDGLPQKMGLTIDNEIELSLSSLLKAIKKAAKAVSK